MSFYYFRLRVAAVLRPICMGLSVLACCMVFIPGAIAALDSLFRVSTFTIAENASLEESVASWQEIISEGEISRHHRLADKKTALWWVLVEYQDLEALKKALSKKERKEIKRWLNKNKRNLEMQLAYHKWLYRVGDKDIAVKRVKNLAHKFPEYKAFAQQYRQWTKKNINVASRLDKRSLKFLEAR